MLGKRRTYLKNNNNKKTPHNSPPPSSPIIPQTRQLHQTNWWEDAPGRQSCTSERWNTRSLQLTCSKTTEMKMAGHKTIQLTDCRGWSVLFCCVGSCCLKKCSSAPWVNLGQRGSGSACSKAACAVSGIQPPWTSQGGRAEMRLRSLERGKGETISLSFTHPSNPRCSDSWWEEGKRRTAAFCSAFCKKRGKKKRKKRKNLDLPLLNHVVRKWAKTKLLPMWSVFYWLLWSDASREHKLQYNIQCTYLAILLMKTPPWAEGFDNVNHVSLTLWQASLFSFLFFFFF